jgi:lipoyl(octanoyl) transferase
MREKMRRFDFKDLGMMPYEEAYELQLRIVRERMNGAGRDTVLLLEHPPVYTLGRRAKAEHILGDYDSSGKTIARDKVGTVAHDGVGTLAGAEVVRTDRGGDITFHGPGQLVIYPIIALRMREQKIRRLLQCYEEVIIQPLRALGVDAFRIEGKTGVWTPEGKIASIGIAIRRWVTYHGIALNVATDLAYFDRIIPCGLRDCTMVSLNSVLTTSVTVADMKRTLAATFEDVWEHFPF